MDKQLFRKSNIYSIKNIDNLQEEELLFLLKKINLNYFNVYIIKEEDIFSENSFIYSFILLKKILIKHINIKYPETNETTYFKLTFELSDNLYNNIIEGNIKYNLICSLWEKTEIKKIIIDKFNILFLNDIQKVEICTKKLDERYNRIINIFEYIKKLLILIKLFNQTKDYNNIDLLINLEKEIKNGMLNTIEKTEIKDKIDEIYKIIPNLEQQFILVESLNNIFLDEIPNYKNILIDDKNWIENYFLKYKNNLNEKNILSLNENIINEYIIKEEEIFSEETNIDSFEILEIILEKQINMKYPELNEIYYFKSTIDFSNKIFNKIKEGNIQFSIIDSLWSKKEIQNMLWENNVTKYKIIDRLQILFFNDIN